MQAVRGRVEAVRLLLSLNADATKSNHWNETAYRLAQSEAARQLSSKRRNR